MIRRPPRSSLPDTLFPDTTLFRSRPSRWEETDGQPYQTAPAHQGGRSGDFLLSFSFPLTHRIVMPIMAEHRWLYQIDWPELSRAILFGRANGLCEHCHHPHGQRVFHLVEGRWWDRDRRQWRDGTWRRVRVGGLDILGTVLFNRVITARA